MGTASNNVYAVGDGPGLFHYDGSNWSNVDVSQLTTDILFSVWGNSASDVFVAGDKGTILHWDGSQWSNMNVHLTDQSLISIWGTSAGNVFAVGYKGTILHYDGSGWAAMSSHTDRDLIGIWGSSANNVLTSGANGTILHYDGSSWAPMHSGTKENLGLMWGTSGQNIYVTGNSVKEGYNLFHYNGSAWSKTLTSTDVLYGVWGSSASDVYVVGDWGDVFHYNGIKWSKISCTSALTADTLFDIWGNSAFDIFAVGDDGAILHYSSTQEAPTVTSVNPGSGMQRQTLNNVIITGTNFITGQTEVNFSGAGITAVNVIVNSATQLTATITIGIYATPGARDITVITPDGNGTLNNGFAVIALPPPPPPPTQQPQFTAIGSGSNPGGSSGSMSSSIPTTQPVVNPTIIIQSASISRSQTSGEPVIVSAIVANTSTVKGVTRIKLYVNGQLDSEQAVTVASGKQIPVSFAVSRNEPGTYQVYVNNIPAGSFTVNQFNDPNIIAYTSGALIFLALILGIIYIFRKRQYGY